MVATTSKNESQFWPTAKMIRRLYATAEEKAVLWTLLSYTNAQRENAAWPAYETLADEAGVSRRFCIDVIKAATKRGIISKVLYGGATSGHGRTNSYTFDASYSAPHDTVSSAKGAPDDTVSTAHRVHPTTPYSAGHDTIGCTSYAPEYQGSTNTEPRDHVEEEEEEKVSTSGEEADTLSSRAADAPGNASGASTKKTQKQAASASQEGKGGSPEPEAPAKKWDPDYQLDCSTLPLPCGCVASSEMNCTCSLFSCRYCYPVRGGEHPQSALEDKWRYRKSCLEAFGFTTEERYGLYERYADSYLKRRYLHVLRMLFKVRVRSEKAYFLGSLDKSIRHVDEDDIDPRDHANFPSA